MKMDICFSGKIKMVRDMTMEMEFCCSWRQEYRFLLL